MTTTHNGRGSYRKGCSICRSPTTTLEKTKWGPLPHWYKSPVHGFKRLICKNCYYQRIGWQKNYVPEGDEGV